MAVRVENYGLGFKYASLALTPDARDSLIEQGLNVLSIEEGRLRLFPQKVALSNSTDIVRRMETFDNFDVFEIWEDGSLHLVYDDSSNDNYLFVTGRCNSNCIMCPSPVQARMRSPEANVDGLIELVRYIPSDVRHLTITGGEPFLAGKKLFRLLSVLKDRLPATEFLFLTNGRIFALESYVDGLVETMPSGSLVAIPLHGSVASLHDRVTQAPGSFEQTTRGIRALLEHEVPVELRLVVNRLNMDDFDHIADLILADFKGIEYVSVIAMEMTGAARVNRDRVWVPYGEAFRSVRHAVNKLLAGGVDVKLYNFPLCTVDRGYWTLCEKSISPSKVRFAQACESCGYRTACGGVFAGTLALEKDELEPLS